MLQFGSSTFARQKSRFRAYPKTPSESEKDEFHGSDEGFF
jgi:hypothetical protein